MRMAVLFERGSIPGVSVEGIGRFDSRRLPLVIGSTESAALDGAFEEASRWWNERLVGQLEQLCFTLGEPLDAGTYVPTLNTSRKVFMKTSLSIRDYKILSATISYNTYHIRRCLVDYYDRRSTRMQVLFHAAAHELGHVLGLAKYLRAFQNSPAALSNVMRPRIASAPITLSQAQFMYLVRHG